MSRPRLPHLALLTAASGLALTACGGGGSSPDLTAPADAGLAVFAVPTIRWDQTAYTAEAGEVKVFLGNNDNTKHVLVILEGDKTIGDLELTVVKKGDSAEDTITLEPGEYFVYCIVPGHGNMKSTLTVS